jgi:hypothetical protein
MKATAKAIEAILNDKAFWDLLDAIELKNEKK